MWKPLSAGLALALLAHPAAAIFQFDIRVSDLEANVDCWDSASCTATEGWIHLYNTDDANEQYTVPAVISQGGNPLAFNFQCNGDDLIDCANPDLAYGIDHVYARFEGWGFFYEVSSLTNRVYECGPAFPVRIIPEGGGCDEPWPLPLTWDCLHFPGCQVAVTDDFTVQAGETLTIGAGMEIYFLPGVTLTIEGEVEASGTNEDWITFRGNHWGGLVFNNGADAVFDHCVIRDVDGQHDGGALTINGSAVVHLFHSLVAHNTTSGMGGGAFIADQGLLSMYRCTVSHNTAQGAGIYLGGGTAFLESVMSLVTFNEPANSDVTGVGFTNVVFTDIFPQSSGFPSGMAQPYWCDPGYVDADNFDFHVSYWSVSPPPEISCAYNLGAFPFDMHLVLSPARDLVVEDRPHDEGGFVLVNFAASPNDGAEINPVNFYSIWERQPGMEPGQWLAVGTVGALSDPDMVYHAQVPTLDDQYEGHENLHVFRVGTHSAEFGQPAWTAEVAGFSVDNIAPPLCTNFNHSDWYYDMWPPTFDLVDINWDFNPPNDFAHFIVLMSLDDDFDTAVPVYEGVIPATTLSFPFGQLTPGQPVYVWIAGVDVHENIGLWLPGVILDGDVGGDDMSPGFRLETCAPNPFNPVTRIGYALAAPSQVRLSVYNLAGELVTVLADGPQAAGRHQVSFDAGGLASGVYVYRLETPTFTDTKKMILAR